MCEVFFTFGKTFDLRYEFCYAVREVMHMTWSFAPMEGITNSVFRRLHAAAFGCVDWYYAPFLAPDGEGRVKASSLEELRPERNEGVSLVPQILCSRPEAFLSLGRELSVMGYREINLNAGCPSGTVVPKHKGAGMLSDLESLDRFLDTVFSHADFFVSVKTRLGMESAEEFVAILSVYNRYPISQLIIHARDRKGLYQSTPDLAAFQRAFAESRAPVCYNGNLLSPAHYAAVKACIPSLDRVMLGRGAVSNPALPRVLQGGEALDPREFSDFLARLFDAYLLSGIGEYHSLGRMKELWYYAVHLFPGAERELKRINKARTKEDYRAAVSALFTSGKFDPEAFFPGAVPRANSEFGARNSELD